MKKTMIIYIIILISYSSYSQNYFTKSGTTLYPTSGEKIGLGTTTTAVSLLHFTFADNIGHPIIIQPTNYNSSYTGTGVTGTTADRFYLGGYSLNSGVNLADNRPDVTASYWAYNSNSNGGRGSIYDAAFRFATETHYFIPGYTEAFFEFHIPEIVLYNGTTLRTNSIYSNKGDGRSFQQKRGMESEEWYSVKGGGTNLSSGGIKYATLSSISQGTEIWGSFGLAGTSGASYGGELIFYHGTNHSSIKGQYANLLFNENAMMIKGTGAASTVEMQQYFIIGDAAANGNYTKAKFEVVSTTKGSLPAPRMTTTQRDAITFPTEGLMIYNLTTHEYNFYNGTTWVSL